MRFFHNTAFQMFQNRPVNENKNSAPLNVTRAMSDAFEREATRQRNHISDLYLNQPEVRSLFWKYMEEAEGGRNQHYTGTFICLSGSRSFKSSNQTLLLWSVSLSVGEIIPGTTWLT